MKSVLYDFLMQGQVGSESFVVGELKPARTEPIRCMSNLLIKTLEAIFVFGLVGSAVVVVLTSIEDFHEVLTRDKGERLGEGQ